MKTKSLSLTTLLLIAIHFISCAQDDSNTNYVTNDSITKDGYTLIYINKAENFSASVEQKLKDTFFAVYPILAKQYNENTTKTVTFVIDPAYEGVAATSADRVVYNPEWFAKHPGDIDVVTHEVMHIVQGYGYQSGPWWVTEGIADYVRYKFGVDNAGAGWSLPNVSETQNYDNSYRITARFFAWIVKTKDDQFIEKMDQIMRDHTYTDQTWVELTGKTSADLWTEYIANPAI
ncbi:basic secretory protein-like protein [uncultured Sunxiuqinia sp.]|uniref:basic secretory protein-like protein n=1 Tax=uncultured Sunxiuqinia sp. TaxID=1573825 RepID=UPI002AA695B5|nr:basic secretory protein-like protein [uncultured Sunxiuqinia sp.]